MIDKEKTLQKMGANIRKYRELNGMSLDELGQKCGYTTDNARSSMSKIERGKNDLPTGKLQLIADALGVSPGQLLDSEETTSIPDLTNVHPIETQAVPWIGEISCGVPKFADQDFLGYVKIGADIQCDFCLTCRGDSMINARINDGDIVFIRQQSMVNNGEIAAVAVEDEALLKRVYYYREKNLMILKAENPKYEDLMFSGEEIAQVTILGKAICFQSDIIYL